MSRRYLKVDEYSEKYGVPKSTVKKWIRDKTLDARTDIRPMLIPDDQPVPVKEGNSWRYTWKENVNG